MQTIENQITSGITMTLDDKNFVNCHYTNCKIVYSGGDYAFTETKFENCQVSLAGAAQRTLNLLGNFGALNPQGMFGAQSNPQQPTKTEKGEPKKEPSKKVN